jgi:hypothetical protein
VGFFNTKNMKLEIADLKHGTHFKNETDELCVLLGFKPLNYDVSSGNIGSGYVLFYRHVGEFQGFFESEMVYCTKDC